MTREFTKGSTAAASGAATGWGVSSVFGNVGVVTGGQPFPLVQSRSSVQELLQGLRLMEPIEVCRRVIQLP